MKVGPLAIPHLSICLSHGSSHSHLDDEPCEGFCDNLEKVRGITATTDVEGGNHEPGDVVQVARGSLQGQ